MRLDPLTESQFIEFFKSRGLPESGSFPKAQFYVRRGAKFVTRVLAVEGITFGRHVFIDPGLSERHDDGRLMLPRDLVAHELVHVLQYKEQGFVRFGVRYTGSFLKLFLRRPRWTAKTWFKTYSRLPQEAEARKLAREFVVWMGAKGSTRS